MKMFLFRLWWLELALSAAILSSLATAHDEVFPNGFTYSLWSLDEYLTKCPTAQVCDPDYVLSLPGKTEVENLIPSIEHGDYHFANSTCNATGVQIEMAILWSLDGSITVEAFAEGLYKRWGMGKWAPGGPACDNGILYILSLRPKPGRHLLFVGDSLTDVLDHKAIHAVLSDIEDDLSGKKYDSACLKLVQYLGEALSGRPPEDVGLLRFTLLMIAVLMVILLNIGGCVYMIVKEFWKQKDYKSAKSRLQELQRLQSQLQNGEQFNASSCPICLEDYTTNTQSANQRKEEAEEDEPLLAQGPSAKADEADSPSAAKSSSHIVAFEVDGPNQRKTGGSRAWAWPWSRGSLPAQGAQGNDSQVSRKPLTLPCMHTFCENCIASWMQGKEGQEIVPVCPVCRAPIKGEEPLEGTNAQPASPEELIARLRTLRSRYPQYINDDLADQVEDDIIAGRPVRASVYEHLEEQEPSLTRAIRALSQTGRQRLNSGWARLWRRT